MFMDYMGQPHIPSHLRPFHWAIDMDSRQAAIPGTGNELITMTYSKDVARFLARLLEEEDWPAYSLISGCDVTMNRIVALLQKATGVQLKVTYDSLEDLQKGDATVLFPDKESWGGIDPKVMAAMFGAEAAEEKMLLPREGRLNERFPEIQPMGIEDLIMQAWSGKKA
jgi:hypothetical protein